MKQEGARFRQLSVLIPVFNERDTIERLVEEVLKAPLPEGLEKELVIVDDGSTDGTTTVLKELALRECKQIQIHFHKKNRGKGAAIRKAIQLARGDIIVFQDADLEYDPIDYQRLIAPILSGDADVVYGSRFMPREYRRVLFFWHSVGNWILTTLSNMTNDLNLSDMETCYKMARSDILKSIPIRCNRFGIEPELTAKFAKLRCRIYEVPISYRGRTYEEGKKVTWWDGVKALGVILYFWIVDDL